MSPEFRNSLLFLDVVADEKLSAEVKRQSMFAFIVFVLHRVELKSTHSAAIPARENISSPPPHSITPPASAS